MKVMWLDTETTGTAHWKNDIIQLAGMVEIDGIMTEDFNLNCQPHDYDNVEEGATKVHGITEEVMRTFPIPLKTCNTFSKILDANINRYDKKDKFIMAGYNVQFDYDFMRSWWKKCEQQYWGSYFEYKMFDVYPLVFMFATHFDWDVPNHKLSTICDYMGIPIDAHDAMADIVATRQVYMKLKDALPSRFVPNMG